MIDYSLWEVIKNGNAPLITKVVEGVKTTIAPATAKEKAQRRLELKARSTLLMGIPNEHQLKFNSIKDANQLEIHGESILQEDVNQKFLRSLSPEWSTHTIVWRNKPEIDTLSLYDLYNNLKIYENQRENTRRVLLPVETTILMVWYLVDGSGTDWSDSSREVPTELCTHGLESVEARILVYKKNTSRWSRLTKAIVNVARPKAVVNAVNKGNNVNSVKPQSFVLLGLETKGLKFPTMDLLDKRLIDKWHAQRLMTGKCPIFTDYEEIVWTDLLPLEEKPE
ncbi:hypothetical protein Tco_0538168 [Tanacetum coccineum]